MQNQNRNPIAFLAAAILLLGCGLLLFGLFGIAEPERHSKTTMREVDTEQPIASQDVIADEGFNYSSLADRRIDGTPVASSPPSNPWETRAIFVADQQGCRIFMDEESPVHMADEWTEEGHGWSATVTLGDFEEHRVRVLDSGGRLLRGLDFVSVVEGEPSPVFKYVSR